MPIKDQVQFDLDIKGESTGRHFQGVFTAKTKVSWRDAAKEDEIRRSVIGTNPDGVSAVISLAAEAYAYLVVRLVDVPEWFKDKKCNYGLELEDRNVIVEVHRLALEKVTAEYEALAKEAETAKKALKDAST